MNISVLILTLNEETNLPSCLEAVNWCDDIVVFDSFSTDRTVEIAEAARARIIRRKFDNYAAQRNAALNEVQYRYPWVFMIDADERFTPELRAEVEVVVLRQVRESVGLFRVRRKDMFLGHWLRRSSCYPTWFGRLIRVGKVRVEREINEEYHTDGEVGYLQEHLLHYPFNKGIAYWYERHNQYSSMEAAALIKETANSMLWRDILSRNPIVRRKAQKQLAYRLPVRPLLVFCYLYLMRLGLLDGKAGLAYCMLRAFYEFMIDLKVQETLRRERGLHA